MGPPGMALTDTRRRRAATLETPDRVLLLNAEEAIGEGVLDPETGEARLPHGYDRGVIKDGARGALVIESGAGPSLIATYPVRRSSNVGSGDLFAGVVAARLATGDDLLAAAKQAAAATSAVLASGDTFAPPDLPALTQRLIREHKGQIDWRWPLAL
jgi:ribokinase